MSVFLVRHAESLWNAARIVQLPETPLSPRGCEQAHRLARRLAGEGLGAILSSDLARAAATADAVAAAAGIAPTLDPDLRERDFGAVRGTPYAALGEDIFGPTYVPPGGESWDAFHARVDRAWTTIAAAAARAAGHLLVVTHGLVCYSLLSRRLTPPAGVAPSMRWGNTSVTIVDGAAPWRVRLLDCTAHLDGARGAGGAPA